MKNAVSLFVIFGVPLICLFLMVFCCVEVAHGYRLLRSQSHLDTASDEHSRGKRKILVGLIGLAVFLGGGALIFVLLAQGIGAGIGSR